MLDNLEQLAADMPQIALGLAILAAVVGVIVWLRVRLRQPATAAPPALDLRIELSALAAEGPPARGPQLELYHLPMRLVALVVAPLGRGQGPPDSAQLTALVDQLIPGMAAVLNAQQPLVCLWPTQLSAQGFTATFFSNVPLPGDKGKGTPWCVVAGRFEASGQKLLAGLVLHAAAANNLSHVMVERESQWLDICRVRQGHDS